MKELIASSVFIAASVTTIVIGLFTWLKGLPPAVTLTELICIYAISWAVAALIISQVVVRCHIVIERRQEELPPVAQSQPARIVAPRTDTERLDYLERKASGGCLSAGFEVDGGVYLQVDALDMSEKCYRERTNLRQAIDESMEDEQVEGDTTK